MKMESIWSNRIYNSSNKSLQFSQNPLFRPHNPLIPRPIQNQNPTFSKIAVSYTCFTAETGEGLGIWVSTYDLRPRSLSGEWLKWDGSMGLDGESFIGYPDTLEIGIVLVDCACGREGYWHCAAAWLGAVVLAASAHIHSLVWGAVGKILTDL